MTLGELIEELQKHDEGCAVVMRYGGKYHDGETYEEPPGVFCSYRGYYETLAIEAGVGHFYEDIPKHREESGYRVNGTVGRLLEAAREADGKTFEGYKGGDYVMNLGTPIHLVGDSSSASSIILNAVKVEDGVVVLEGVDTYDY